MSLEIYRCKSISELAQVTEKLAKEWEGRGVENFADPSRFLKTLTNKFQELQKKEEESPIGTKTERFLAKQKFLAAFDKVEKLEKGEDLETEGPVKASRAKGINVKNKIISALERKEFSDAKNLLSQATPEQRAELLSHSLSTSNFPLLELVMKSGHKISDSEQENLWRIVASCDDHEEAEKIIGFLQHYDPSFKGPSQSLVESFTKDRIFRSKEMQEILTKMAH